jgi:hypothetical protein
MRADHLQNSSRAWDAYETAYKTMQKAGRNPGLRRVGSPAIGFIQLACGGWLR